MNLYEVVVVGAGQAGIEAALASARMGRATLCVTLRADRIGHLPCNCSIGGPAKGHIAREVDALGGQMALTTDLALTHIRRVGTSKGAAVQTVRAQVCKSLYPQIMQRTLQETQNLAILEGTVEWVNLQNGRVVSVTITPKGSSDSVEVACRAVVLTTGTFLNGLCHEGQTQTVAARRGDQAVAGLSNFLQSIGVPLRRFKTGTTPRINKRTIALDLLETMPSEPEAGPLSFFSDEISPQGELLPCWQTHTSSVTHDILRENLHLSPMFSGQIEGIGPRYCPSVEDKVVRFASKDSHPIFLEQEEWTSDSIYVQGFSTSMPVEVQRAALHTIPGLENCEILVPGYAVEYDMADPTHLDLALMNREVPGLFLAGQVNGTSGYEEAAGQGILAGMNAARFAREEQPVHLTRSQAFIGVMVDDLVTKGVDDPYRMLTARAEHRLLLRHDNADRRLTPISREVGLCDDARWSKFESKMAAIESGMQWLHEVTLSPAKNDELAALGIDPLTNRTSLYGMLQRPGVDVERACELSRWVGTEPPNLHSRAVREQLHLTAVYDGYIQIQERQAAAADRLDHIQIPPNFDWDSTLGLSYESREKLGKLRPQNVGQASRVPGVRHSDIALLIGLLRNAKDRNQEIMDGPPLEFDAVIRT